MRTPTSDVVGRTAGLVALVLSVLFGLLAVMLVFYDGRQDIDLTPWAEQQEGGYGSEMMPNLRWATDELCTRDLPCIQAVASDTLTMYRFARREHAVEAAESFGADGYLTGWIAIRYEAGALTEDERTGFESGIACINTWVGEQGQDC